METFSPPRVSQLRAFLIAAVVIGVVVVVLGVLSLAEDGADRPTVTILVVGCLAVATAAVGVRLLPERDRAAQLTYVAAGMMQVSLGILLADGAVGILPSIIGVLLVMLTLLADTGDR